MSTPRISTFIAAPFGEEERSTPKARVAPAAPPQPAPFVFEPVPMHEPESVADAEVLRLRCSAIKKASEAVLHALKRHDPRRAAVADVNQHAIRRGGYYRLWAKSENHVQSKSNALDHVRPLLDVINRLADDGARLTDDEHDVVDKSVEFVAWCDDQIAVKRARLASK